MIFFPAVFVVFLFMRTYVLFVFVFISVPWYPENIRRGPDAEKGDLYVNL